MAPTEKNPDNAETTPPSPDAIARAMLIAARACEVAQSRGAFKLEEAEQVAGAVALIKSVVKVTEEKQQEEEPASTDDGKNTTPAAVSADEDTQPPVADTQGAEVAEAEAKPKRATRKKKA